MRIIYPIIYLFTKPIHWLKRSRVLGIASLRSQMILFSSALLVSCEIENLPISVQPAESTIAVASLVGPEELVFVSLSRSFSALSAEDISEISDNFIDRLLLDSALVTLQYEGITDTLETFFDISGLYATELQAFVDFQLLELSVFDSTTSETITAQSILQPPVEPDSVIITRRDTTENFLTDLAYSFDDPPDQENFYVIQVYQFTPPDTTSSDSAAADGLFFSSGNFLIFERILTDRGADDDGRIRRDEVIEFNSPVDSALVVLTNIEEGYYNFLEARGRSGNLVSSLANEPVNHPSNVNNGVGYFSAHQPRGKLIVVRNQEN